MESSAYDNARLLHDAWCAAFVWPKISTDYGTELTTEHLRKIERNPHSVSPHLKEQIRTLASQYRFFHWHLEFSMVFGADGEGGFDCIVGNPPWERVKLQEKEYFAERSPEITNAPNAATRKKMIAQLINNNPNLMADFLVAQRLAEGESQLLRNSGLYPLCGRGDINLYAVFAELGRQRLSSSGYMGLVLPSGIASDDTTKFYFQDIVESASLVTLFDFENKLGIFADVAPVVKFCILTTGSGRSVPAGRNPGKAAQFFFFAHSVEDLSDPLRRFTLSVEDIKLLNPNTRTCPIFRSRIDAELTKHIYRRVPVLIQQPQGKNTEENPWGIRFSRMFDMSNDSNLFFSYEQLIDKGGQLSGNVFNLGTNKFLPLYEAKLFHQFNHRPGTFDGVSVEDRFKMKAATISSTQEQLADPEYAIHPRFWVEQHNVDVACAGYSELEWFLAFRGMTNVMTNSRNAIFTVLPRVAVGNSAPVCLLKERALGFAFVAAANSFVFDYITRQKLAGANLNFFIVEQLPVFPPKTYSQPCPWQNNASSLRDWLMPRVLELLYTAWELEPFAKDSGFNGPPFRWDESRRFLIRCELDAAFFHLYGISRDNVDYIMETFPIVKRKDEAQYGSYRTKETILLIYDEIDRVLSTNAANVIADKEADGHYQTHCDPEPGPPVDANGNFLFMYQWGRDNWPKHIHQPHPDWDESILAVWFDVCQQQGTYLEDDQIFPWNERESFVYALIPYLVQKKPGEKFEFYRDAALLASRPASFERLLLDDNLSSEYRQLTTGIAWLNFADGQHIRPRRIREALQGKQIVRTAANSGVTEIHSKISLPPLPIELMRLLPLILKAAENLDKMQRSALENAEAAKITFTQDEIANELKALSAV